MKSEVEAKIFLEKWLHVKQINASFMFMMKRKGKFVFLKTVDKAGRVGQCFGKELKKANLVQIKTKSGTDLFI